MTHFRVSGPTMLFDPQFFQDPYPTLTELRESAPLHSLPMLGSAWAFTRHADVVTLLRDPSLSARRAGALVQQFPEEQRAGLADFSELFSRWMLFFDPPDHTRIRRALVEAFHPSALARWRGRIETIVTNLLDRVCEAGRMDAIHDFAHPLPALVISEFMGVPEEDRDLLVAWTDDIARFFDGSGATLEIARKAQQSLIALTEYLAALVDRRRREPGDDLITRMAALRNSGQLTSDEELHAQCAMLLFAGHETTRNLIGNGMVALLRNPHQAQRLASDSGLYRTAIDELLRFDSPVQIGTRLATAAFDCHGHAIRPGDLLLFLFGSANHDPREFAEPGVLDLSRAPNRQVSFGSGFHACLGAQMARMEGEAAFRAILSRCAGMELAAKELEWNPTFGFRGLKALPVRFNQAPCDQAPHDQRPYEQSAKSFFVTT